MKRSELPSCGDEAVEVRVLPSSFNIFTSRLLTYDGGLLLERGSLQIMLQASLLKVPDTIPSATFKLF